MKRRVGGMGLGHGNLVWMLEFGIRMPSLAG